MIEKSMRRIQYFVDSTLGVTDFNLDARFEP